MNSTFARHAEEGTVAWLERLRGLRPEDLNTDLGIIWSLALAQARREARAEGTPPAADRP